MATSTVQEMFFGGRWQPSASGETFEATSPATGELIATVPQGDRDDATRAIDAARGAADGWARLTAFERAAKMHAVGDLIEARRDDLARTLTLDQGKPLRAEAFGEVDELVEYWRMAAEDAKRLGGRAAELVLSGQARDAGAPPARRRRRDQPVELAVHDAGRVDRARARVRQRGGVDAGAFDRGVRGGARGVHSRRGPAAGGVQPRDRAWPGGRRRDRPQPRDRRRRVHRLDRDRADRRPGGRRQGGAARDGRQRPAGRDGRRRRRGGGRRDADRVLPVRRSELHRRRADSRPPRGARRVRRAAGASRDRADPARGSVRRRDHDGPAQQRAGGGQDGRARRRRGGARRERGQRWRASRRLRYVVVLAADRPDRRAAPMPVSRSRRRSARSPRSSRSTRSSTRSTSRTPRRTACSRRSSPPTSRTDSSSPIASTRAGSTSTSRATTGRRTSRSAAAPAPTAGSAGSGART